MFTLEEDIEYNLLEIILYKNTVKKFVYGINYDMKEFQKYLMLIKQAYPKVVHHKRDMIHTIIDNLELIRNNNDTKCVVHHEESVYSDVTTKYISNYTNRGLLPTYMFPSTTYITNKKNVKSYIFKILNNVSIVFDSIEYQNDPNIYRHIYIKYEKQCRDDISHISKTINEIIDTFQSVSIS